MQCAYAILSSVARPALQYYFPTFLINRTIFEKNLLNPKCVLIFSTNFVWNIPHSEKDWARYSHICISVFMWSTRSSGQFLMKFEFFDRFSKDTRISLNFFHCQPSCWMRTDGPTDMSKRIVAFRNSANAPDNHLERTDNARLPKRPQLQTSRKKRPWTPQETMAMRRCRNGSNDLIHGGRWWWWWWCTWQP